MRAIIPLVLLAGVVAFWAESFHRVVIVSFVTPAARLQALAVDREGLVLFFSNVRFGNERSVSVDAMTGSANELEPVRSYLLDDPATVQRKFAGFRLCAGSILNGNWKFELLLVPYWFVFGAAFALAAGPVRRLIIRWRRRRKGQCLACGYDLRASAGRCPECGLGIPDLPTPS